MRRELESRGIKALIVPPFYWGINRSNNDFPGTFTVRDETLEAVIYDKMYENDPVANVQTSASAPSLAVITEEEEGEVLSPGWEQYASQSWRLHSKPEVPEVVRSSEPARQRELPSRSISR